MKEKNAKIEIIHLLRNELCENCDYYRLWAEPQCEHHLRNEKTIEPALIGTCRFWKLSKNISSVEWWIQHGTPTLGASSPSRSRLRRTF